MLRTSLVGNQNSCGVSSFSCLKSPGVQGMGDARLGGPTLLGEFDLVHSLGFWQLLMSRLSAPSCQELVKLTASGQFDRSVNLPEIRQEGGVKG